MLDLDEARDEHVAVHREPVSVGLLLEGLVDPGLPVDEGSVAVGGYELDVFGEWHGRALYVPGAPGHLPPPDL